MTLHTIDLDAVLAAPLSPRERQIVTLRYVKGMRNPLIAERLGISVGAVTSTLWNARNRSPMKPAPRKPTQREYPGDEWFARNVALVRTMGPSRKQRYLNAFGWVWGTALRERLERAL